MNQTNYKKIAEIFNRQVKVAKAEKNLKLLAVLRAMAFELADYFGEKQRLLWDCKCKDCNERVRKFRTQFLKEAGVEE